MYWIQASGVVARPITVTLTACPGSISSSSTWIEVDGPATGVLVGVGVAVDVVAGAGAGVAGGGVQVPVPGSKAPVRSELGNSPGRATQPDAPGLYWARNRLPCMSCARSVGRFWFMMTAFRYSPTRIPSVTGTSAR